jgi:trehalose 6-phosphate phosphatase
VSGRAVIDLQARVGLPHLTYVGNHGLDRWQDGRVKLAAQVASFRPKIEGALRDLRARPIDGMLIEDKGATISIHYRLAKNPDAVAHLLQIVVQETADEHGLNVFPGRMIFELRPPIGINKGTTFRELIQEYALEAAVYLGDDTTDVDALRMAGVLRRENACFALGIGVESADMPLAVREEADLLATGVPDVEAFLGWLLQARRTADKPD